MCKRGDIIECNYMDVCKKCCLVYTTVKSPLVDPLT